MTTRILPLALCALSLFAQAPPTTPKFETTADEVLLDVVVRDKKGKPIKDLTKDDIRVFDDGVERKIRGLRLVEGEEAVAQGGRARLDALRQVRLVTLAFQGMDDTGRRLAREAALNLVRGAQGTNVFYSVVTIDAQLNALQQFTTDKEALRKAIELATSGKYATFAAETDRVKRELSEAIRAANAVGDIPKTGNPGQDAANTAIARRTAEIMLEMVSTDINATDGGRTAIFALLALVRGQHSLAGRKSVLYFSPGMYLPTNLDEPFRNLLSAANRGNVAIYSVDTRGVTTWSQNQAATETLNRANQVIKADVTAIDGGITKEQMRAGDAAETAARSNTQLPLRTLAESTGGFLIADSNDLRPALRQVNEEINSYYEVSYSPEIATYDGRFRKTKVEVARDNLVVHSRNGYFAMPLNARGPAVSPVEFTLLKALDAAPAPDAVAFRTGAAHMRSNANGATSLVLVEVPMSGIQFTEDKNANTFTSRISMLTLIKDAKGEVVKKLTQELPRSGPLNLVSQLKLANFIYSQPVDLPPGSYMLETVVADQEAQKSGVRKSAFTVVARTAGVGISSLSLVRGFQPNANGLQPADLLQFQGGKITPTLSGHVVAAKGAQISTFFIVEPDPTSKEKATANIEFLVDGQPVAKADLPLPGPDAAGKIPYVMSVPAEGMPPATYEIHITAVQGASKADERMKVTVEAAK